MSVGAVALAFVAGVLSSLSPYRQFSLYTFADRRGNHSDSSRSISAYWRQRIVCTKRVEPNRCVAIALGELFNYLSGTNWGCMPRSGFFVTRFCRTIPVRREPNRRTARYRWGIETISNRYFSLRFGQPISAVADPLRIVTLSTRRHTGGEQTKEIGQCLM
jgi:hypothetical protein